MENTLSASDIALMNRDGDWGGNSFLWIFALLILANGGFGGWGNNRMGDLSNWATASSQNEILLGQKFDALGQKVNQIGDGICSSTYALNNSIQNEGRALQTQLAEATASTNATTIAQTQKILDAISQNKIESLQAEVNNLKTQNMFCGIPRINPYGYGVYQYQNGCGYNNI